MAEKLVLIDGHSILNRAFFGVPDLTNAEGFHTNAIYGFLNIMFRILEEEKPQYLAVAFDVHAPTFRHEMYPEYKGTRKPMAEELREQVPVMKEMLKAMNIAVVEQAGLEADDILGTLAKKAEAEGMDVALVSGDRDLLQIASDHIMIRIPKTKRGGTEIENYYAADVEKTYQLSPARFIELKALMGDSSDNVPGVPKVGEKTATELMVTYGSIEGIYEHLEEIKKNAIRESLRENKEILDLCLKLVTIKTDCELPIGPKDAALPDMYTPEAYELCRKLEFKAMLSRFGQETKKEQKTYSRQWVKEESAAKTILQGAAGKEKAALLVYPLEQGDFILSVAEAEKVSLLRAGDFKEGCLAGLVKELYQKTSIVTFDSKRLYAVLFGNVAGSVSTPKEETQMTFEDLLLQSDNTAETPKDTAETELRIAEEAVAKIEDLLLAGYLLNPLKSDTQIEDLAKQYLDELITPYEEKFGKKSYAAAVTEDKETFAGLAAQETAQLLPLYDALMQALTKQEMAKLYREVELPLSYVLYCMEREGIQADAQALKVYGDELASQITVLEKKIYEAAGEEFNINSPKQLAEILFEKMHLPGGKKTKTGYSTSAEVLEKLAPDVPFVRDVLEYRTYAKLKSTYADGLATFIASDGRIHTKFNQTITATGRLSSTDPNLQNIPIR
ncbi:MAG: DNA polymerase I, partial [Lachnospiraceae bacterium]|nr:DNA polymerase I [Lachnospiraceae bacterium]